MCLLIIFHLIQYAYLHIVRFCVGKLKPQKDDGKYGLKSDHLINDTNKLFTVVVVYPLP